MELIHTISTSTHLLQQSSDKRNLDNISDLNQLMQLVCADEGSCAAGL